ncbi:AbfB domain-containing protein [Streptomyces sp. NPDC052682]|uniref:AbfB domain-containing protein n=1 Tax=Streptomyces sp. NPDC052682 TaxID=3154954 RepID=UPI0034312245
MPDNASPPSLDRPWESGWVPDTTRAPGTRRLWLAGALAVATVAACLTSIALLEDRSEAPSTKSLPSGPAATVPGLISFPSPTQDRTAAPGGKKTRTSPSPSTAAPTPSDRQTTPEAPSKHPEPPAPAPSSAPAHKPASTAISLRSVNYPDRYWHVSDGSVRLDQIGSGSEQREDATFRRVAGLADSSCSSFATADGRYLRHRSFVLVKDRDDGSALFRQDATFCPRPSPFHSGAVMLESVNYRGRFLRHQNFQIRLDPYQNTPLYQADSAFRVVAGLG